MKNSLTSRPEKFTLSPESEALLTEALATLNGVKKSLSGRVTTLERLNAEKAEAEATLANLKKTRHQAESARQIPVLREQIEGLEEAITKAESKLQANDGGKQAALLQFGAAIGSAITPHLLAEEARVAEILQPIFRTRHNALLAAQQSDFCTGLRKNYSQPWGQLSQVDFAITVAETTLRGEFMPVSMEPNAQDKYVDEHSQILEAHGLGKRKKHHWEQSTAPQTDEN